MTDPADRRRRFTLPAGGIYLDSNSLGPACDAAEAALAAAVASWKTLAIRGWTAGPDPWSDLARRAAGLLAPVLGADPAGVAVGGTTTGNLHQLLASFYDPTADRPGILIDDSAFPTDRYAVESHLRIRGRDPLRDLHVVRPGPDRLLDEAEIIAAFAPPVGFAVLPAVIYTSGQLLDIATITTAGRAAGVTIAWDCSHSAGAVDHAFLDDGVDLAFGCGYKYLNGGPGAAAWLYVAPRLLHTPPGLAGWFGGDPARMFEMTAEFHPAADAGRYLGGTPHVFSLAPLAGALELFRDVGMAAVRARSLALTARLRDAVERRLAEYGCRVVTPRADARRGGHVAVSHPHAGRLAAALRTRGVVPDFRPPDIIRFAPSPLVTSSAECDAAVEILRDLLEAGTPELATTHERVV